MGNLPAAETAGERGTHHIWSFAVLVVGLIRLETPGHRGDAADHFARFKGASEDPRGAVLHHHLWVGVYVDSPCGFCDWNETEVAR